MKRIEDIKRDGCESAINQVCCCNCLDLLKLIPDECVDMIFQDIPYNITDCEWDKPIPIELLWKQWKRIISPKGSIILTASQPFTTILIASNFSWYCYSWVWIKESGTTFLSVKYMPMRIHEDILVFSSSNDLGTNDELRQYFYDEKIKGGFSNKQINKMLGYAITGSGMAGHYFKKDKEQFSIPKKEDYEKLQQTGYFQKDYKEIEKQYTRGLNNKTYNPQMTIGKKYIAKQGRGSKVYGNKDNAVITTNGGNRYPTTILYYPRDREKYHPTQKPVALFEYLIRTYSNEGDLVFDGFAGSFTTAVACGKLNRNFIGCDISEEYCKIGERRLKNIQADMFLENPAKLELKQPKSIQLTLEGDDE